MDTRCPKETIADFKEDDWYFAGIGDPLEDADIKSGNLAGYKVVSNAEASMRFSRSSRDPLQRALRLHGRLLWARPPRTWTYGRLEAVRRVTAWNLCCAWLPTASSLEAALHDLPPILVMGKRMHWAPLLSPPFLFDEMDAVQMILEAARCLR